ncbi:MAG: hypothetical protein JEZ06_14285 [Anaerolineaceae bacterium]|nr:hypothetical protein [Anaerolineaceae bacterium]
MKSIIQSIQHNRSRWIILSILIFLFALAIGGMETKDWMITVLRGLAVGSITFLVASGFSIIFGLMDVLNLAHGTLFMVGAYIGWTVYTRPDTVIDAATPVLLLCVGFILLPLWETLLGRIHWNIKWLKIIPWIGILVGASFLIYAFPRYPITGWSLTDQVISPGGYSLQHSQNNLILPTPEAFTVSPFLLIIGILLGGIAVAFSFSMFKNRKEMLIDLSGENQSPLRMPWKAVMVALVLLVAGLLFFYYNHYLSAFLVGLDTSWLFLLAILVAVASGLVIGGVMESTLIRPLYNRPIYNLMLTLGVSGIGFDVVRSIWGNPEFTMMRPSIFNGSGEGCPATSLSDLFTHQCSTISILGGRVRTYNEVFIPILGFVILIGVWLLLQRTRLGMTIRAGVQDSEMVEAMGINIRSIFTWVFALGVGLATLGGVIAAPSMGLNTGMGETLFLNALIALAIGGLTSYPGAAAGSFLVGLLQQFVIKYGSIGINLPFLAEPFKPTPPLVPASTILLMVIILLVLPQGLFGRKE